MADLKIKVHKREDGMHLYTISSRINSYNTVGIKDARIASFYEENGRSGGYTHTPNSKIKTTEQIKELASIFNTYKEKDYQVAIDFIKKVCGNISNINSRTVLETAITQKRTNLQGELKDIEKRVSHLEHQRKVKRHALRKLDWGGFMFTLMFLASILVFTYQKSSHISEEMFLLTCLTISLDILVIRMLLVTFYGLAPLISN